MSSSTVKVNIPVLKTKKVTIEVKTKGIPAEGYEVTAISYQPDIVTVAGSEADLFLLGNRITAYCDITGANDVVEDNFDIEIIEKHHNQKLDAPSGTAIMLGNAIKEEMPDAYFEYDDVHEQTGKPVHHLVNWVQKISYIDTERY